MHTNIITFDIWEPQQKFHLGTSSKSTKIDVNPNFIKRQRSFIYATHCRDGIFMTIKFLSGYSKHLPSKISLQKANHRPRVIPKLAGESNDFVIFDRSLNFIYMGKFAIKFDQDICSVIEIWNAQRDNG